MNRRKSIIAALVTVMALVLCGCENVIVDTALSLLNTEPEVQATAELSSVESTVSEPDIGTIGFDEGEKHSLLPEDEAIETEVLQKVLVNLSGYESTGEKIAVFRGEEPDEKFEIVDVQTEKTVFSGYIVETKHNNKNGETNARGDFSSLTEPGTYYIRTKYHGSSAPFTIEKGFYQRILEERKQYFSEHITGISDGAQFNRSIMQTADWLLTYEYFMKTAEESGTPELLTLAKEQIEALRACQDEKAGSITSGNPVTQAQAYRYAALLSMFADIYEEYETDYAQKCRESAAAAWEYAEKQDRQTDAEDEHYWAAAQLYKLTGEAAYLTVVKSAANGGPPTGFSEEETGYLGSLAYLTTSYKTELKLSNRIMKALFDDAIEIVNESEKDGYLAAVGDAYNEESVQRAFSNARLLTLANVISKSVDYVNTAGWNLEYLYGRNPFMENYAGGKESAYYDEPEAFVLSGLIHSYILDGDS
ncbi:MAG: glycoside hydrolase family 9 protein [Lachnospiraceae bacterium]